MRIDKSMEGKEVWVRYTTEVYKEKILKVGREHYFYESKNGYEHISKLNECEVLEVLKPVVMKGQMVYQWHEEMHEDVHDRLFNSESEAREFCLVEGFTFVKFPAYGMIEIPEEGGTP